MTAEHEPVRPPTPPPSSDRPTTSSGKMDVDAIPPTPTSNPTAEAGPSRHTSPPHLDLATYPTTDLLRLLASLLQQIASANDQLRHELPSAPPSPSDHSSPNRHSQHQRRPSSSSTHPAHSSSDPPAAGNGNGTAEQNDDHHSRSNTPSSSSRAHFPSPTAALFPTPSTPPPPPSASSPAADPTALFTASKISLAHPSSLLSFHARHIPSITIEAYLLRILKYCPTTNEVFLGLLVYFDRMSRLGTADGLGGEGGVAGVRAGGGRGFAIDSYNVHRLVIAGVTVASKFFSDVFYTNSRYAKVGGLPPHELNQLELQFLLLNDFRLVIPPDEMQRYGDRLLSYWQSREDEPTSLSPTLPTHPTSSSSTTADSATRRHAGESQVDKEIRRAEEADRPPVAHDQEYGSEPTGGKLEREPETTRSESTNGGGPISAARQAVVIPQEIAPRGRERDTPSGGGGAAWSAPAGVGGGMAGEMGRMASPMRD